MKYNASQKYIYFLKSTIPYPYYPDPTCSNFNLE